MLILGCETTVANSDLIMKEISLPSLNITGRFMQYTAHTQDILLWTTQVHSMHLTLSPPNKLSPAKFLVCFNFKSASMSLKVDENIV